MMKRATWRGIVALATRIAATRTAAVAIAVAGIWATPATAAEPLHWVKKPTLTFDPQARQGSVTFELDALSDVEVAIVDPQTGAVVRHLAAGVLGPGAPPPLAPNSRTQKLLWDGKDDYHANVARPAALAVRVRAGMNVRLEQIAGGDPYAYYSQEIGHGDHSPFGINGLELKGDGKVYVLGHSSNLGPPALRQYDIDGNYLQTIFPPPAGKPVEAMRGWGIHVKPDGTYTPQFNRLTDPSLSTTFLDTGTGGMARLFPTPDVAGLSFLQTGFGRDSFNLLRIHADGTISDDPAERLPGPLVVDPPFELGPIAPDSHVVHSLLGPVFTCFAADGKSFYLSGIYAATTQYGSLKQYQPESVWRDGQVWKVDAQTRKARVVFALDPEEVAAATKNRKAALGGSANYAALHGVAEDSQGNVFIADRLHRRIVVLDRAGKLLRELAVEHPDAVAVSAGLAPYTLRRAMATSIRATARCSC